MKSSGFFKAAFGAGEKFIEGKEGVMYMPDDHPGAVALFAEWLYSGRIESSTTRSRLESAYELYILATKLMNVEVMDKAMDLIQDMSYRFNQLTDPKKLARIYEGTEEGSKLRQFGVDYYHFGRLWKDSGFEEEDDPQPTIWVKDWPLFTVEEMQAVWEETKESFDLFQDILRDYRIRTEDLVYNPTWTVRSKGENELSGFEELIYEKLTCKYHAHAEGVGCGPKVFVPHVSDWVDDGEQET